MKKIWIGVYIVCVMLLATCAFYTLKGKAESLARLEQVELEKVKKQNELFLVQCNTTKKDEYNRLMADHKYWEAANEIRSCSKELNDPTLKKLVYNAELASHIQDINASESPLDEARAISNLIRDCPGEGKKYAYRIPGLDMQIDKENQAQKVATNVITSSGDSYMFGVAIRNKGYACPSCVKAAHAGNIGGDPYFLTVCNNGKNYVVRVNSDNSFTIQPSN